MLSFLLLSGKISSVSPQSIHQFAEKVALITDGTSPIGRAVALQLALQGSYVIVGDPQPSASSRGMLNELRSLGTLAHSVEADASTFDGARSIVEAVDSIFGRLDFLINCLKTSPKSSFEDTTDAEFDMAVRANFGSAYFVARESLKLMTPRPKPKIVNIVPAESEKAKADPLFSATRAAVIGFTSSLAAYLPGHFRVNCVELRDTKAHAAILDPDLFPPGTGFSADDAARVVTFLLSSEAAGLNGQVFAAG